MEKNKNTDKNWKDDWKKIPFGIDFVVEQDLIPLGAVKHPNSDGYSITCPFCQAKGKSPDKKHSYTIDIYKNVGHCFRCQSGHGMLSLHQALSKNKLTLQEAKDDLMKRWNGLPSDVQIELKQVKQKLEEENKSKMYPAPTEILDQVYNRFLDQLTLSEKHHQDLVNRGMSEEQIIKGKYKSVPAIGLNTFAKNSFNYELSDYFRRHVQQGVPGFFEIRTSPKIVLLDPGYFVPIRNEKGLISGMQIRFDKLPDEAPQYLRTDNDWKEKWEAKKDRYAKYKWFVSNYRNMKQGCTASGCENVHYTGDWSGEVKTVILTEGVLKADLAAELGGLISKTKPLPMLGLVGVYNTEGLCFELMKRKDDKGLQKVIIAVDMDYREKPQVAEALNNIKEIVKRAQVDFEIFNWNPLYKGIDDFFLATCKKRQLR